MKKQLDVEASQHSKVIEFGSKTNVDNYIGAGWKLIKTRAEPFALGRTIIVYRVGWPEGAGEPVMLRTNDDLLGLEEGPSAN